MATKKDDDITKQAQAKTKDDVDSQDTATRLYQSLNYTYGQQQEQSDKTYDQAISQQDRTLLSRGMQRSSYGAQTLANLQNQKAKERNRLGEAMIADYQTRLSQLEEAEAARKFQTSEREAQQAFQSEEAEKTRAYSTSEREAQQAYSTAERLAQQAYSTSEREAQQQFTASQSELERAQTAAQFAEQMALQREQNAEAQRQFEETMAYNREKLKVDQMSDEQKLIYSYIETALKNGSDVSDELLAKVGMTRADFNLAQQSSGGYSSSNNTTKTTNDTTNPLQSVWDFLNGLFTGGDTQETQETTTTTPKNEVPKGKAKAGGIRVEKMIK